MKTRRIEWLETVRIHDGEHQAGDRGTYPKDEAGEYIRLGWAQCVETGEKGERSPGSQRINVHNVKQETTAA